MSRIRTTRSVLLNTRRGYNRQVTLRQTVRRCQSEAPASQHMRTTSIRFMRKTHRATNPHSMYRSPIQYNIDGGAWQTYTGSFSAPPATADHTVYARAIDNAGNTSSSSSLLLQGSPFTFDAATGTITGYTGTDTNVVIPSQINGVNVTHIGGSAFAYSSVTSITIPNGVTSIGDDAFYDCSCLTIAGGALMFNEAITNVTIPNGVTSIGDDVFSGTALATVTIPNGVVRIGNNAFCLNLNCKLPARNQSSSKNSECINQIYRQNGGSSQELPPFAYSLNFQSQNILQVKEPFGVPAADIRNDLPEQIVVRGVFAVFHPMPQYIA